MWTGGEIPINHLRKALPAIHCLKEEEKRKPDVILSWNLLSAPGKRAQWCLTLLPILETLATTLKQEQSVAQAGKENSVHSTHVYKASPKDFKSNCWNRWVQQSSERRASVFCVLVMRNWTLCVPPAVMWRSINISPSWKLQHQRKVWGTEIIQIHSVPWQQRCWDGYQFSKHCWTYSVSFQSGNWPHDSKIYAEIQKIYSNSVNSANNIERLCLSLRLSGRAQWTKQGVPVWWQTKKKHGTLYCPGTGPCVSSVSITVLWKSTGNVESFRQRC